MRPHTFIPASNIGGFRWVVAIVFVFLVLISACKTASVQDHQGVSGQVTWVSGNLMPPADASGKQGVMRTLHIYEATSLSQVTGNPPLFDHISSQLVATIRTNAEGHFQQVLQPGKYSIFVKEGEQYYANRFTTDNFIQTITVKPNKWESINIVINYSASY